MKLRSPAVGLAIILVSTAAGAGFAPDSPHSVERWGVFEAGFNAPPPAGSPMDVKFSATFTQGGRSLVAPGFWDGGDAFKVRFSPPTEGEWSFRTSSEIAAMDGKTGSFKATPPAVANHGPVEVFDTFYLRYADGAPYHQFGTTCYAWVHQPEELQERTLKTLAASPFNKIRFCVFPKSYYIANKNEPERFAFQKGAGGKFDFGRPDPDFWRLFERRILDLQKLGVEADVILWHPYDRWGFSEMSDAEDDRYLRYCIARLSAFRNVWWSLANEYDFMTDRRPGGHGGNKQWEDWDRFFAILRKEDPHQRLRSIHNGVKVYDHAKDWVTHASLQSSDMNGGVRFRARYHKPVVYDECRYEGDLKDTWGNLTAREMTRRFWLGTLSGCYVGHGETYKDPQDILWWSKGGELHGQSPRRIAWLKEFMAQAPAFHELRPLGDDKGRFLLAKPGEFYLLYCLAGRSDAVELPPGAPWKVDALDPWTMTERSEGSANGGRFEVVAAAEDRVFRFTRYAPGERLRPVAQPSASVTQGVAPLLVAFKSDSPHRVDWDFGDGSTSDRKSPSHVFSRPGVYPVSLTVTDEAGGSARAHLTVLVDSDSREPLLRAGFGAAEDTAGLRPLGTARRSDDGGFTFTAGAPWGRIESTEEASDLLGGLRSFTIGGWLKPEDLATGSGGNRILFTLEGSKAGLDLVHDADGRLRLAVNEWPDGVKDDSTPGRLVAGRWTFFTVTYDSTRPRDNVTWYFSEPIAKPDPDAAVRLDRRVTYNVGPVAEHTGPVAVGNFNRTMEGYGYDRQFRGEIRGLTVHGSRISGRGAIAPIEK